MKKLNYLILSLLIFISCQPEPGKTNKEQLHLVSKDGVKITADLYKVENHRGLILLFHQAGFSRGEYLPIIPKLTKMGFSCLSIDQRSGDKVNNVVNLTHLEAKKQEKPTQYTDAIPDIDASIQYALKNLGQEEFIYWGSSYSAALSFYFGSKYPKHISGIIAFSPGEYFEVSEKGIPYYAAQVKCPVFISSAKSENKNWQGIFDALPGDKYFYIPDQEGYHGSRALWPEKDGHQEVWTELVKFLNKID